MDLLWFVSKFRPPCRRTEQIKFRPHSAQRNIPLSKEEEQGDRSKEDLWLLSYYGLRADKSMASCLF